MNDIAAYITSAVEKFSDIGREIIFANVLSIFGEHYHKLPFIVFVLLFGSIFFMFKLKFISIIHAPHALKLLLNSGGGHSRENKEESGEKISSLKALFVVIGGAAGLGNVAGVAVAISQGGPGAAFWMFLTPFITMPLRYAEVYLGHKYRVPLGSGFSGGPCQYMRSGFSEIGLPKIGIFMAFTYAVLLFIASFGGGCSFQMNQAVQVLSGNISFLKGQNILLSLIMTGIVSIVIFGGLRRIADFISVVVPIMIGVYFLACLIVILCNYENIIPAFKLIMSEAFTMRSVYGGIMGAFTMGFTRIVIANETGLGTAAIMHSNSSNDLSAKEALISMASPVIDTLFVCLMSALVVIISGVLGKGHQGIIMTTEAFATVRPWFSYIVIAMVPLMAMNVLIAWSYYGLKNFQYLFGHKMDKLYIGMYVFAAFCGGIIENVNVVVKLTDVINTSVAIPNVISAIALSGIITYGTKKYFDSIGNNK